jgi:hypothetical protein
MGIANVIQTATSATHHHHTELPKISSQTELLIGIMKSQRVKKKNTSCVGTYKSFVDLLGSQQL